MRGDSRAVHLEHAAQTAGARRAQAGDNRGGGRPICAKTVCGKTRHIGLCLHERGKWGKSRSPHCGGTLAEMYPALPGNPEGAGKYLLQVGSGSLYLDALKQNEGSIRRGGRSRGLEERCGLGGKANTNPGKQNARFKGSKIIATRVIRIGEEIFVPYRRSYKFGQIVVDEERCGWGVVGRRFYRDMG